MKSVHSGRLERWLGLERIEQLSNNMKGWYGPPINLLDCPGSVWMSGDGDFVGDFDRGFFDCAADSMERYLKRLWRETGKSDTIDVGFTSISNALSRASSGFSQTLNGTVAKDGVTGVAAASMSLWTAGTMPGAGAIGSAPAAGRAPTKATAGAMQFANPSSGTLHLTGADISCSVVNNALMLYDRIFDVAKNMNSATAESVTGVPTRYQSSVAGDADFAGGNFMFPECITILAATAHNHDAIIYRDQDGNDTITAPSMAGLSACIAMRLDMPVNMWFTPLLNGDSGVKDLNSIKVSAAVATGTLDWVIGHPIGIMSFPVVNMLIPFDWLTNRNQAPRIFDDACLALLELPKPATTAGNYRGMIYVTSAAA